MTESAMMSSFVSSADWIVPISVKGHHHQNTYDNKTAQGVAGAESDPEKFTQQTKNAWYFPFCSPAMLNNAERENLTELRTLLPKE